MKPWLGITWSISNRFGWGIYGLNLVLELLKRESPAPVCFGDIVTDTLDDDLVQKLQPAIQFQQQNLQGFYKMGQTAKLGDAMVLHALGNGMDWSMVSQGVEGDLNAGVIFFEYSEISIDGRQRLSRLNGTVAGSTWNADVLKSWGIPNVETVFQGVDINLFRPITRTNAYEGKFAVFSGGKLDFRKGQDIVLAAFKRFAESHPDAVLVTAWQNLWPLTALPMKFSPHTQTLPDIRPDGSMNLQKWAAEHGVPAEQFIDLGMQPNAKMPDILKDMDLAIFPNRCEGGTNLVAMETMACGIPCVLSENTGHLDLTADDRGYVLHSQRRVDANALATDGWGESDVDELVACMEAAYDDRQNARDRGQAAANFMKTWAWPNQIDKLMTSLDNFS
ncbi:glycosyltransferase family 4 protein [Rhodospirillales bacterium]|nr:glycosyltransferase family 4 protein [Rhodospirillales bacterium]